MGTRSSIRTVGVLVAVGLGPLAQVAVAEDVSAPHVEDDAAMAARVPGPLLARLQQRQEGRAVLAETPGISAERHARAKSADSMRLSLLILNQSAIPHVVLVRAEAEATRIYSAIGVTLGWITAGAPDAEFDFTVKIVTTPLSAKEVDGDALGVAPGTKTKRGTIAYAFCGRIEDFSRSHNVDMAVILGHVIAHELGHLLLPYSAHTKSGIMSGGWDDQQATRAARGALTFNAAEGGLIREALLRAFGNDRRP